MMTMMVSSAAPVHAHAPARKKRRPAGSGAPVPAHAPAAKPTLPATAATPAPPAPAAAAPAPAAPAAPEAPKVVASPEYDPVDITGIFGDIAGGTTGEFVAPHIKAAVGQYLNPEQFPFLGTEYGKVIPGKVAGVAIGQVSGFVGSVVGDALRGVLHGKVAGVGEPEAGLGWKPTPPNKLIAGLINGIGKSWANIALKQALAPPPPPPPPVYPPDVKPLPQPPVPAPPAPKKILLTDSAAIADSIKSGLVGTAVSAVYDQVVAPLVQRAVNVVTGRGAEEIKKPAPLTPGRVVNGLVDGVLSSMLVRSVSFPEGPPGSTVPFAGALGASITNGILGAAWSTVYGRGLGTAIENGVNDLAGLRTKEEKAEAKLPALEHFSRAATRGVAVGATTYMLGNALNATMIKVGAQVGGLGGALIAMAGAALIGSIGGSVVDATIGPMLGKIGGQIYSWLSGKPSYEQRMKDAAAKPKDPANPGPTPGDPVKAPNGNPGTVPAPSAPAAPAAPAPAAGAPRKRKKTGVAAVDRTSPAINLPNAKLAAIAARG
ncbi:MAG: hypothetical protein JWM86_1512 [Thermoleophilia bacterium]|nr:hypothetical protein [Thermoleophilia bacterium]